MHVDILVGQAYGTALHSIMDLWSWGSWYQVIVLSHKTLYTYYRDVSTAVAHLSLSAMNRCSGISPTSWHKFLYWGRSDVAPIYTHARAPSVWGILAEFSIQVLRSWCKSRGYKSTSPLLVGLARLQNHRDITGVWRRISYLFYWQIVPSMVYVCILLILTRVSYTRYLVDRMNVLSIVY